MSEINQPPAPSPQPPASSTQPFALCPLPLYACLHAVPAVAASTLVELARDFSPRFECHRDDLVSIDIRGLDRLVGDPHAIGGELRRSAAARGLRLQVAIASTRTASMVLAHTRPGLTVVERGHEAEVLASIPIGILEKVYDDGTQSSQKNLNQNNSACSAVSALKRWGVKTLGELAALPAAELAARLGPHGLVWQAMARGQDIRPLVPTLPEERFESSTELEWPIEGLEPLSFVLTRLLEPLSTRLERRDRGVAALHVGFDLVVTHDVQRTGGAGRAGGAGGAGGEESLTYLADPAHPPYPAHTYTRTLELPAPLRDVRTLRTLILLDLESHPPPAAIERVTVVIDPTPGRVLQHTLFTRAHPTPEQLSTLIARLTALMGQDRIGRPAVVDSYRPGAFGMMPFAIEHDRGRGGSGGRRGEPSLCPSASSTSSVSSAAASSASSASLISSLRRCRYPVPARVAVAGGRPVAVTTDRRGFAGGRVQVCTGPWRTSGEWWEHAWNRDEWDVSLSDGAVYRIFRDRVTDGWFIDAIAD
jgi:protein ImuB